MRYQVEETIHNFPFWSGAKDTIEELTYDEMNSLEQLIEEVFGDDYVVYIVHFDGSK